MENQVSGNKEVWISYIDDTGLEVKGFVILLEQTDAFVKIRTNKNILTISLDKIFKL